MLLCEHCIDYLKSCGYKLMVSSGPAWEYEEGEEIKACEWCEDQDKEELYHVEFM